MLHTSCINVKINMFNGKHRKLSVLLAGQTNRQTKVSTGIEVASCLVQCVFFIELKVFVNLTYLYLSEIKKQGLIFSVGLGHLIICQKKIRSRQRIFI